LRITRDTAAVYTATDNSEVENSVQERSPGGSPFTSAISLSVWIKSQPNAKATQKGN
jgi:hypothetical protein